MKLVGWLALLCGVACSFGSEREDEEARAEEWPVVKSRKGLVRGREERALGGRPFYSFRGIPFAKPPLGELRFKRPVPSGGWRGVLDATQPRPKCLQYPILAPPTHDTPDPPLPGHEDCLYLNVFTPAQPNETLSELLPVMIYIHGGAFFVGGADEAPPYALLDKNIVLVVIQYRLSILGFLSTEDNTLPGNMGLWDQQLAIKWVKETISDFGGDSESITLFGESAGGASVHMHMLSPGSKGLFQRAIAQSGTAICPWAFSEEHASFAKGAAKAFDCPLNRGETEAFLVCMQGIAAKFLIMYAASTLEWAISPAQTIPRIDGDFFPDRPEILLKEGRYNKVDFLTGITRDEGLMFTLLMKENQEMINNLNDDFEKYGPISLYAMTEDDPEEVSKKIYQHYLGSKGLHINGSHFPELGSHFTQLTKMYGDFLFALGYDLSAYIHAHDEDMSVYLYQLNHEGQYSLFVTKDNTIEYGISHADDLFYLFEGHDEFFFRPLQRREDLQMRRVFIDSWTNFATYGDPTPAGSSFVWQRATPTAYRQLDLTPTPTMAPVHKSQVRNFFLSLNLKQMKRLLQDDQFDLLGRGREGREGGEEGGEGGRGGGGEGGGKEEEGEYAGRQQEL